MVRQHHWLNGHEFEQTLIVENREAWHTAVRGVIKSQTWFSNWTTISVIFSNSFPFYIIIEYWAEFSVLYSRSLLIIYLVSFNNVLWFSKYKSFTSLVNIISRDLIVLFYCKWIKFILFLFLFLVVYH